MFINNYFNESKLNINNLDDSTKKIGKFFSYKKLKKLESTLLKNIKGQEKIIYKIIQNLTKKTSNNFKSNKPISSFLFCGPTGVGKTEVAKIMAKTLFPKHNSLLRFDMSEYMDSHSTSKLIGIGPGYVGYKSGGLLTSQMKKVSRCVLLFDEIEKAHPKVLDLFLQILDEGHIKDNKGSYVFFKKAIIIFTSNLASKDILNYYHGKIKLGSNIKEHVIESFYSFFRPELINRFEEILVFKPLFKKDIAKVVAERANEINVKFQRNYGITLKFTDSSLKFLLKKGYHKTFGARYLNRILDDFVTGDLLKYLATLNVQYKRFICVDYTGKKSLSFSLLN